MAGKGAMPERRFWRYPKPAILIAMRPPLWRHPYKSNQPPLQRIACPATGGEREVMKAFLVALLETMTPVTQANGRSNRQSTRRR